jgi:CDP-diacylglycerol--glycerol-3-phosphate 3-phosphatidyltransferase
MFFVKHVPNALSLVRVIFSWVLLFLTQKPLLFTLLYCLIATTDMLDGLIARKYHIQSKLGSKLDGLGDLTIFIVGFCCIMFRLDLSFAPNKLSCFITLAIGAALKAFSFVLTRVRFKEWNMMHTIMNKLLGMLLYLAVPYLVIRQQLDFGVTIFFSAIAAVTVLEDTIILMTDKEYNANHPGLLVQWWKKRGAA